MQSSPSQQFDYSIMGNKYVCMFFRSPSISQLHDTETKLATFAVFASFDWFHMKNNK